MGKKNYMTVVFEYEDGAELPKNLTKAFADNVPFVDTKITAVSREDECLRVEQLENQLIGLISVNENTGQAMKFWRSDYQEISDDLLAVIKQANQNHTIANLDKCICEYKKILGSLKDESDGLKTLNQLRGAINANDKSIK